MWGNSGGDDAPAGPLPADREPAMPAPGFNTVRSMQWCDDRQIGVWATLLVYSTFAMRLWFLPLPASAPLVAGVLAYCGACAALLTWQRSRCRTWRRSYERWREPLALAMRLAGTGFGSWPAITGRLMATWPPAARTSTVVLLLVFASGGPSCLHHALSWRMRFWVSALVQAVLVASIVPYHASYCAAMPALTHPDAQRTIHTLFGWLSSLAYILPFPVSAFVKTNPASECAALLTWMHVCIGLLVPVAWEAHAEARLFKRHQARLQERGAPPEQGVHATVFDTIAFLVTDYLPLGTVLLIQLSVAFDWCAFFSIPVELRSWERP